MVFFDGGFFDVGLDQEALGHHHLFTGLEPFQHFGALSVAATELDRPGVVGLSLLHVDHVLVFCGLQRGDWHHQRRRLAIHGDPRLDRRTRTPQAIGVGHGGARNGALAGGGGAGQDALKVVCAVTPSLKRVTVTGTPAPMCWTSAPKMCRSTHRVDRSATSNSGAPSAAAMPTAAVRAITTPLIGAVTV